MSQKLRTPGRGKPEQNYSDVGRVGRKTGVTVKQGALNEDGLEVIDGIFSSPEKAPSPRRPHRATEDVTTTSEIDMDVQTSTPREPTEVLNSIRKPTLLAKMRSPIRTSLKSPARRSVGPRSSPMRDMEYDTPSGRGGSLPVVPRTIPNLSVRPAGLVSDSERSPPAITTLSVSTSFNRFEPMKNGAKPSGKQWDLSNIQSDDDAEEGEPSMELAGDEPQPAGDSVLDFEDDGPVLNGNSSPLMEADDVSRHDISAEKPQPIPKNKGGRPRKTAALVSTTQDGLSKTASNAHAPNQKKRGRPARNPAPLQEDEPAEAESSRPAKRPRRVSVSADPPAQSKPKKLPPSQRSPHASVVSAKSKGKTTEKTKAKAKDVASTPPAKSKAPARAKETTPAREAVKSRGRPKKNTLLTLEREKTREPSYEPVTLRTGRQSVKPVAFWRGDRINYSAATRTEAGDIVPGGLKNIEAGTNAEQSPPKKARRQAPRKKRALGDVEEEDVEMEQWETDEVDGGQMGTLYGPIALWDPITNMGVEEEQEEIELAVSAPAVELRLMWNKGETFRFAKTLTMPFFHSGVVDIPPGGHKAQKNSRRNVMMFWVFSGRVTVQVADNTFSVGKGGMWHVPRGNFYAMSNPHDRATRIMFAQGCYMEEPEEGLDVEPETDAA